MSTESKELYIIMGFNNWKQKGILLHGGLTRYWHMNLSKIILQKLLSTIWIKHAKANGEEWTDEVRLYIGESDNGLELCVRQMSSGVLF